MNNLIGPDNNASPIYRDYKPQHGVRTTDGRLVASQTIEESDGLTIEKRLLKGARRYMYTLDGTHNGEPTTLEITATEDMTYNAGDDPSSKPEKTTELKAEVQATNIQENPDRFSIREQLGQAGGIFGWFVNRWRDLRAGWLAFRSNNGSERWARLQENKMRIPDHIREEVRDMLAQMRSHAKARRFIYGQMAYES